MVEYPGSIPGVREGGGFTVHCITIDASTPYMVEREGIEPLVATLLDMTTGLQPATGNTFQNL